MSKISISLSILEYESQLSDSLNKIKDILATNAIDFLHIDIMRRSFVGRDCFDLKSISELYSIFGHEICFDFHLITKDPNEIVIHLNSLIKFSSRAQINLTLPIEIGEPAVIIQKLKEIKQFGYQSSLALEPSTPLDKIPANVIKILDKLLIMSVSSGVGGQPLNLAILPKLKKVRAKYPNLTLQVDGGINQAILTQVIHAGANNVVVGSYITQAKDPILSIRNLLTVCH